ncbi:MAG: CARDB domain-containing protein, partial [Thermoplasmatota archaeon]
WKEFTIDVKQTYGVDVEADSEDIKGDVGDDVVFKLTLSNLGNDIDTFRIEVRELDSDGWATLSNTKLSLDAKGDANEKKTFTLTVSVPDDTEEALSGSYEFQINIKRDSTSVAEQNRATASITLTVDVQESYEHVLETEDETDEVKPGETVSYRFKVQNRANIRDTFYLSVKGSKSDWAELQYNQITLGARGSDDEMWVWLNITVPDIDEVNDPKEVEAGTYDFTVEVESKGDREAAPETIDFEVDVEQSFEAEVSDIKDGGELGNYKKWDVNDEDDLEIEVTIQNNGNKDDTFYIKKPSAPTGWEISVSQTHVAVPMGDEKTITITISFYPTDGFVFGSQTLKFEVIPDDGSTQGKKDKQTFNLYINAEVPELVLRDDSIDIASNNEVTVTVYNIGTADAKDVEVVLYDGKQAYRTDKKNVPAGAKINFTFDWKPSAGDHKLEAKVNEGDLLIEQDTDNNEVEKKKNIPVFSFESYIGNIWVVIVLIAIILLVIIVVVLLAMNKNREIRELEEIIAKLKTEGTGPGGPRKVIKEAAGAPVAPQAAAGLPSAPGKLAPIPPGGVPDTRGAKKENVKVQCPKCLTQQVVTIDKRPSEVPCKECGVTLVIPEKKK